LNYQPKTQQLQMGFRRLAPATLSMWCSAPFWCPILRHCCQRCASVCPA
jgi:hypothetical protein